MYPYSFIPLQARIFPLALSKLSAGTTDAATGASESGAGLNNNISLLSGDDNILNSGGSKAGIIIVYFIIIFALVAVLFLVRKFLLTRIKGFSGGKRMRVADRVMISQDKQIMMIELAGKMMIVGVTNQTVSRLAMLEKDECAEFTDENGGAFVNILSDKLGAVKRQSATAGNNPADGNKDE